MLVHTWASLWVRLSAERSAVMWAARSAEMWAARSAVMWAEMLAEKRTVHLDLVQLACL